MARQTETIHPHAFRVIEKVTFTDGEGYLLGAIGDRQGYQRQWGPYATLGAAKGILTGMKHDNERYPRTKSIVELFIEKSPEGDWERVEV